jgi:hypothetical protein
MNVYHYTGRKKTGATTSGHFAGNPTRFVASRHRRGWRSLTVWNDTDQIGRIWFDPDTCQRLWTAKEVS